MKYAWMVATLLVATLLVGPLLAVTLSAAVPAVAEELPLPPPPPPVALPPGTTTAPIPNTSLNAPITAASEEPSVALRLYRARPYEPGMGFAPGSRYQSNEDRKVIQTPGVSVSVPLQ